MAELQYYVIDTESTGLKNNFHELTEIGIVRVKDRVQLARNIRCKFPERASFKALEVTNKKPSDLLLGNEPEDVVDECNRFFEQDGLTPNHRVIVGHNIIGFDKKFLHSFWKNAGKVFPANLWLDTMELSKKHAGNLGLAKEAKENGNRLKYSLGSCVDMFGVTKVNVQHTAKADSRQTYFLFKEFMDKDLNYLQSIKTFVHADDIDSFDVSLLDER